MTVILIKNADILTINADKDILKSTDILIKDNKILKIAKNIQDKADVVINASGKAVLPGFVQTHVHLCQTLFRGLAENKPLLSWLRENIWPYEALHNSESTYYSALIGLGELISGGTTTILDMGGVNHQNQIFYAIAESGIRAFAGKAMMDCGLNVPPEILESTDKSIEQSMELYNQWNGAENGRIHYAFAPRFILSCSDDLFKEIAKLSDKYNIPVHTHAYENRDEGKEVFALKERHEFEYFSDMGLLNDKFLAAHCVWVEAHDIELMKKYHVKALHCPSSNFKLGSGMCNIKTLLDNNISVSIGADGAPCNNNLDMIQELRTTALMQNVLNYPGCIDAYKYIELATIEGAKALGLDSEIGSIEEGKKADLIIMNINSEFYNWNPENVDLPTRILYSASRNDIDTVIIDGKIVFESGILKVFDKNQTLEKASLAVQKILKS